MSAFADLARAAQLAVWEGVHARVVTGERISFALVELDPGAVVPEHSHPHEQVGILLQGRAEFVVAGERRLIEPGGSWCIPGDAPHEVTAGPDGAVVVECFSPTREDWAGLEPSDAPQRWPA
jgi:quercetin dioxygenase-like cupin family protein